MKRLLFILFSFGPVFSLQAQYHAKQYIALEPGAFIVAQKSWFFGDLTVEKFGFAGGINFGIRKGDRHGLQISPMISMQQGIVISPPCSKLIPPCPRQIYTVYYAKLPIAYRITFFMNDAVIIKAFLGPQASMYVYPSKVKPLYQSATFDIAGGLELCHYISGNLYVNYGLRVDRTLSKPIRYDVNDEYGNIALASGSHNANMTAGMIIGIDFLLERKIKKKSSVKPGAGATGKK